MEDNLIRQELINTGLVDKNDLHYFIPTKHIQKHVNPKNKKSGMPLYIGCLIITILISVISFYFLSAWAFVIVIPLVFITFIIMCLIALFELYGDATIDKSFDMIESITNIRLSDGTVCYSFGTRGSERRIVVLKDEVIPAFKEFIKSNADRKSDDFYYINKDNRDKYGMGSNQSLTIDIVKKYIEYRWIVY